VAEKARTDSSKFIQMKKEPESEATVETQNERKKLSLEEATLILPEGKYIHTFRNNHVNMMIGADWERNKILALVLDHGAWLTGPIATSMGHGLWIDDGAGRGLFVETRKAPSVPDVLKSDPATGAS